jgi:hypothetical protein
MPWTRVDPDGHPWVFVGHEKLTKRIQTARASIQLPEKERPTNSSNIFLAILDRFSKGRSESWPCAQEITYSKTKIADQLVARGAGRVKKHFIEPSVGIHEAFITKLLNQNPETVISVVIIFLW